jgi:hypothetical protein
MIANVDPRKTNHNGLFLQDPTGCLYHHQPHPASVPTPQRGLY